MWNRYLGILQNVTWNNNNTIILSGSNGSASMRFFRPKNIPMESINYYLNAYTEHIGKAVVIFENGCMRNVTGVYETTTELHKNSEEI